MRNDIFLCQFFPTIITQTHTQITNLIESFPFQQRDREREQKKVRERERSERYEDKRRNAIKPENGIQFVLFV